MFRRVLLVVGLIPLLVGAGSVGAIASAASVRGGAHEGFLLVSANGEPTVALPPGQAKRVVRADCGVSLDVDAIRVAFPNPVTVCPGVTVTSQVPAETETPTPIPVT